MLARSENANFNIVFFDLIFKNSSFGFNSFFFVDLTICLKNNALNIAKFLIEKGANLSLRNDYGATAFGAAVDGVSVVDNGLLFMIDLERSFVESLACVFCQCRSIVPAEWRKSDGCHCKKWANSS